MKPFVLDGSITLAWCFEDEATLLTLSVLDALGRRGAVVPDHWPLEVANGLVMGERRSRIKPADTARFLAYLAALPIDVDDSTSRLALGETLSLARLYRLSVYDAAYLELALRLGVRLATLDQDLRSAARKAGVAVLNG